MSFLNINKMEITLKDIKRVWLTDDAINVETKGGKKGKELFAQYSRLRNATKAEIGHYETSEFGIHWPTLDEDLSFNGFFHHKEKLSRIGEFFSKTNEINVSAFARKIGISQPLMADYISGKKTPSEKQRMKILNGIHELGKELQAVEFA